MIKLFGWLNELGYMLSYQIIGRFGFYSPIKKGVKGTVVMLYGWLAGPSSLYILKRRLEQAGYSVHVPNLGWQSRKIEDSAKKLNDYVKQNNLKDFTLIGYSLGALIGYYFCDKIVKTKKLITLGAPFGGVPLARPMVFSNSAIQITPNSDFLKELSKNAKFPMISIIADSDEFVPRSSSSLSRVNLHSTGTVGHFSLIFSRKACDLIIKFIDN